MDSDGDPSSSGSGSGVWEKSENSKWIVVAETKHRIPRKARVRTVASVDPSLGIREFITSFEPEEPQPSELNNSILVGDGSSLVRLDSAAGMNTIEEEAVQPGPSSEGSEEASHEEAGDTRRTRRRRQRRHRGLRVRDDRSKRVMCVSVESSPGRASPSPESLSRIVLKYPPGFTGFS